MDKFRHLLVRGANHVEIILAFLLTIGMIVGLFTVVRYIVTIPTLDMNNTYDFVQQFLSMALLLVIGIELVLMLLSHSSVAVLDLILFATARKMLVYSDTMIDILLATAAIAIVFAIKKYLVSSKYMLRDGKILSAASPIKNINFDIDTNIPENKANTIGGLLCRLSEDECKPIEPGAEFTIGDIKLKIVTMKDGLIEDVEIQEISNQKKKNTKALYGHKAQ
ncbi:transporter associated domain-containing protein [Isachenkonia alkalipeptolytica]|uniref:Transporter-associated domain-containing protein n=1 Tax=Isachenkonia alkalipeptolytica TaxID=2565777 RepID=A0AA43XJU1_9CLOT|nr:transporter associated domain-containing protein [Isachenkonia alkalipeptolytica]NBG87661.1 hypothetical protein [Isachenkonia alkalipeptolytica]